MDENKMKKFREQFGTHKVPALLEDLFRFGQTYGAESYSECFYLSANDKTGIKTWSEEPEFYNAFIEFATANGSGSFYTFWLQQHDLEDCPIVVFGDEGGIHVVAANIRELLQLLTFDREISVDFDAACFYKDEDETYESPEQAAYADWLQTKLNLNPVTSNAAADLIIAAAKDKHQLQLNEFLKRYGIEI
jgi:hypothetical protein